MNGTFVESSNISCYITVDFAKEEGYFVIKQLVSVHCSFLYFELVLTITLIVQKLIQMLHVV